MDFSIRLTSSGLFRLCLVGDFKLLVGDTAGWGEACLSKWSTRFLAFPEKLNFIDSVKFCKNIGGEIAVAEDFETVEKMQNALSDFRDTKTCPLLVYTGILNLD